MKSILALIAGMALTTTTWAQYRNDNSDNIGFPSPYQEYVTFNMAARYGVVFPMGGTQGYIDKVSPANLALEGEWLFPKRFAVGIKTGY